MAEALLDAFILFNEREDLPATVAERLEGEGIRTYLWRRDVKPGDAWEKLEDENLRQARAVLVFLGIHGWGPNHLKLTEKAMSLGKHIIPILIGSPSDEELEKAQKLFRTIRYINLTDLNPEGLALLEQTLRGIEQEAPQEQQSERFTEIIRVFVDGSEMDRAEMLRQVRDLPVGTQLVLADVLRKQIMERFPPGSEKTFADSMRDPKRISSIRSWMLSALIWTDSESAASVELFFRHLDLEYEGDRNVRFWLVAGLYQRKVKYLVDVVVAVFDDPAIEILWLARAISPKMTKAVISQLNSTLHSKDFEHAWAALRVLRIVSIPTLVPSLCKLLGRLVENRPITYDVLYALSLPETARLAAPNLRENPGTAKVVSLVVHESRDSSPNAVRNFAILLRELPKDEVRDALQEAAKDPGNRRTLEMIRDSLDVVSSSDGRSYFIAGYASDTIDTKKDYLDIRQDVKILTAVMLAKQMEPPLAIGLFGAWGSGKSFFMQSMRVEAKRLSDEAIKDKDTRFCTDVVAVEFNAWHYSDTNLLASLVSYIYEKLADHVIPEKSQAELEAELLQELTGAKAIAEKATLDKKDAQAKMVEQQAELDRLQAERLQKEITLKDLRASDVAKLIKAKPELKKQIDDALKGLGIPKVVSASADLSAAIAEANTFRGRVVALANELIRTKSPVLIIVLIVVFLGLPALTAYLVHTQGWNAFTANVGMLATQVAAILTTLAAAIRKVLPTVKGYMDQVETAKAEVDKILSEKREEPSDKEKELVKDIAGIKAQEAEASAKLDTANAQVQELEGKLQAIQDAGSLQTFLREKRQSEDYRKHLGLISTIRKDFEALKERLSKVSEKGNKVDRIVLFIDDLDRCSAEKVVEVLQAVHLLLAYPLFVVVVGVDSRWLLHSLEKSYSAFREDKEKPEEDWELWRTTPQNYLEKIFQIPFNLSPMRSDGFRRLIDGLFVPTATNLESLTSGETPAGAATTTTTNNPSEAGKGRKKKANTTASTSAQEAQTAQTKEPAAPIPPPEFTIQEQALVIRDWEADFAARLFELVPNPRAAKRFTNIYRILKAPLSRAELIGFEGTANVPGTFQIPMLLLALLIGHPDLAADLFPKLFEASDEAAMTQALKEAKDNELGKCLLTMIGDSQFPMRAQAIKEWLPRVSRFSFEVGHVLPNVTPS